MQYYLQINNWGGEIINKKMIISWLLILLLILVWSSNTNNNKYTLDININKNSNVNDLINYKEIINTVRSEYHNNDIVGILSIYNTDYRTPIVQGEDNSYYLNHSPDGKEDYMGSIYLDYRVDIDSSRKLLIYGHNSSRVDMPFKILEEYYDIDYFNNHRYMSIITSNIEKEYEIFSVYVEPSDYTYMNLKFDNDYEYYKHILNLKKKSMYDTGVEVFSDDEILILQTCSTHKDYSNYEKKYLLILLRRNK